MKNELLKKPLPWVIGGVMVLVFFISRFSDVIIDWLWFTELGYDNIFWRLLFLKIILELVAGLLTFAFLRFNLHLAFRKAMSEREEGESGKKVNEIFSGEKYRVLPSLW